MPPWPVIMWIVQSVLLLIVVGDKWVHGVTGKKPLEARITDLEKRFSDGDTKLSEKLNDIQKGIGAIQILQARQDEHLQATDRDVVNIQAVIRQWKSAIV